MKKQSTRPGRKLDPDPRVRKAIVAAATQLIRDDGVRSLGVAQVLDRAGLGTRAFYRHFQSKDELVAAVFLDMARVEARRLRKRMVANSDPVDAVVAWIDARLDLAFSAEVTSELRKLSLEAQSQMFAAPELVGAAYGEILTPLVEQLERGGQLGSFTDIDATAHAMAIQGAVWASTERQWATGDHDRRDVRRHVLRFCLRGLGVAPESIAKIVAADDRPAVQHHR
ncbi:MULTISPECIES: TetR/AcrR family transcriptional regulator [unclassified Mycobacterium]|uniref:TetR/AcrR family transcriptional regulator n=1 Tax=unclassified Mycobacterium TaxID=2642494 RepID=UPI0029C897C2|nr:MULTISPECIES: TetR/AcrR family transcriptional regulator [unclassified Mycobacterium]